MYEAGTFTVHVGTDDGTPQLTDVTIPWETIGQTECPACHFDSVYHTITSTPACMTIWSGCDRCED